MEKKIKLHGGKDDTYAWRKKEKNIAKNHRNIISTLSTLIKEGRKGKKNQ